MGAFRSQYHQPSGFNWSGVYVCSQHAVNFFHWWGFSICRTPGYGSECYLQPFGGGADFDVLTIVILVLGHFHLFQHFLTSLITLLFGTWAKPQRLKLLQTRGRCHREVFTVFCSISISFSFVCPPFILNRFKREGMFLVRSFSFVTHLV